MLTDVGSDALATVIERRRGLLAEAVADWTDTDADSLVALLERLTERFEPSRWADDGRGHRTTAAPQRVPLMFDPVFGALFWGKMFAVVAVWTHGIVAAIVMYDATHSALMVGMVGVVQFGPQLF